MSKLSSNREINHQRQVSFNGAPLSKPKKLSKLIMSKNRDSSNPSNVCDQINSAMKDANAKLQNSYQSKTLGDKNTKIKELSINMNRSSSNIPESKELSFNSATLKDIGTGLPTLKEKIEYFSKNEAKVEESKSNPESSISVRELTLKDLESTECKVQSDIAHADNLKTMTEFSRSEKDTPRSDISMFSQLHKANAALSLKALSQTELQQFEELLAKVNQEGKQEDISARKMILYKGLASQRASFESSNSQLRKHAMGRMEKLSDMVIHMTNTEICDRFSVINHGGLKRNPIVKIFNSLDQNIIKKQGLGTIQQFEGGCGATSILTILAENDPFLAAQLTDPKMGQEASLQYEKAIWEKVLSDSHSLFELDALWKDQADYNLIKNASSEIGEGQGHKDLMDYLSKAHSHPNMKLTDNAQKQYELLVKSDNGKLKPVLENLFSTLKKNRPVASGTSIGGDQKVIELLTKFQTEIGLMKFAKIDLSSDYDAKSEKLYSKCLKDPSKIDRYRDKLKGFDPYKAESLADLTKMGINSVVSATNHYMCIVGVSDNVIDISETNPSRYDFVIHDPGSGKTEVFSEAELRTADDSLFAKKFDWDANQKLDSIVAAEIE